MRNFFSLLFVGMTILMSCSKENGSPIDGPLKSSAKVLLSFDFTIADNSVLTEDCIGVINGSAVSISVPFGSSVTALKASFTSSTSSSVKIGSTAQQSKTTTNDFTNPQVYTVIAEDGTTQNYTVTVTKKALTVAPMIKNKWMTFTYPYNAYYPYNAASTRSINGHEGNACGPTALAKIFATIKYPVNGVGKIDYNETIVPAPLYWLCDLTTLNLNYSNMPDKLVATDPESKYTDVAKLFFATAAVGHYLIIWNSEIKPGLVPGLIQYFNLDPGLRVVNRWEITREQWINTLRTELLAGRPILVNGRTTTSAAPGQPGTIAGHWFNIDGFDENGLFHVLYNFNDIYGQPFEGYFDADNLGGTYTAYNSVIIGFKAK